MVKVVHVITSLGAGGAEGALFNLLAHTPGAKDSAQVICLTGNGVNAGRIRELGVPVTLLNMQPGKASPGAAWKLRGLLRVMRPEIVQTWMYHADLLGGLAAKLAGVRAVVWGIHHADLSAAGNKPGTLRVARWCARLSGWLPSRIVLAAEAARAPHVELGYRAEKMVVIPNGVDTARFHPDSAARAAVRAELGIAPDAPVVILPARFHPLKDQRTFLRAAATAAGSVPEAQFLLCGSGVDDTNEELMGWISALGLGMYVRLLGPVEDMPRLLAAADIGCLSSRGEAFPLALVEMMACGLPCAVTAAGDAPQVVAGTGRVTPPGDAPALAQALTALLLDPAARQALGAQARQRVESQYSVEQMARRYADLYANVVEQAG